MIRVRSFAGDFPLPALDVTTGSNRQAARVAAEKAADQHGWREVGINFNDGSRPMRGDEVRQWVERHFPEVVA